MNLRPYQEKGIQGLRDGFKLGKKKGLLWLATGGGKTHCFSFMMIEAVQKKLRCLMIVRGRKLVDQGSKRLFRESVTHGVLMAGHWNYRPTAPIQVASIDTLIARNIRPKADLIVIDEVHQAVSDGYRKFLEDYPNAFVVGVTATPYSLKSMRHVADFIVHPISISELIDLGFLVPPRYFAPSSPDLKDVKVSRSTGDYMTDQLALCMDKSSITGDIVSHWQKLAENRPTICFAVNVAHSEHLAEQFRQAGIEAVHCDADTPEAEREVYIRKAESGEIKVICNVGIFCTGVDIPALSCIIMARPTKSYNLYIQQAGRGTRIFEGKKDFILLDHAGNVTRHGFITDEPEPNLEGKKEVSQNGPTPKTCKDCFAIVEKFPCPLCAWAPPVTPQSLIDHRPGELKEIHGPSQLERYQCERFCEEQIEQCLKKKVNIWAAFYRTKEEFGEPAAKLVFFRLCARLKITVTKTKKGAYEFPYK